MNIKISKDARNLLWTIQCPERKPQQCIDILSCQRNSSAKCQVPELWFGNIETAQILFIGKNPSLDKDDNEFPTRKTDRGITERYFYNLGERMKEVEVGYWKTTCELTEQLLAGRQVLDETMH